jgi:uncharacterized membrane protein
MEYHHTKIPGGEAVMPLLSQIGLILGGYLAAGRVGAIAICMFTGVPAVKTLMIALVIDLFQIPVYGTLLEISKKKMILPQRIQTWVTDRAERVRTKMKTSRFWSRFSNLQPMTVVAVSFLPLRGFGIFSACILAFFLNYNRFFATLLIMSGSLAGSILAVVVFYFPSRWFSAL